MTHRTFKVAHRKSNQTKQITAYFVNDAHNDAELSERPDVAVFPISLLYDAETQEARAEKFAEYMNKLAEATRVAHEQLHLVDILSRP